MTPHMIEQQRRILESMNGSKMGHIEVGEAMGFSRTAAQKYMLRMNKGTPKLIYICEYEQPSTGGNPRAIFAVGDLPDVEYQPQYVKKSPRPVPRKIEQQARVIAALAKPMTGQEVANTIHLCNEQVMIYIKILRESTPKQVFIKGYQKAKHRGPWSPIYALGDKPDAPAPKEQTRAERYKKERNDPEFVEREKKRRQHSRMIEKLKKSPVSWAAALGL